MASGVYDPSHVFPEAIKMQGAVQQQSLAALRTGYRMLCDVQGNASLSDKHQQVPLAPPSSPFLPDLANCMPSCRGRRPARDNCKAEERERKRVEREKERERERESFIRNNP